MQTRSSGIFWRSPIWSLKSSALVAIFDPLADLGHLWVGGFSCRLPHLGTGCGAVPRQRPQVGQVNLGDVAVHETHIDRHVVAGDAKARPVVRNLHGGSARRLIQAVRWELVIHDRVLRPGGGPYRIKNDWDL